MLTVLYLFSSLFSSNTLICLIYVRAYPSHTIHHMCVCFMSSITFSHDCFIERFYRRFSLSWFLKAVCFHCFLIILDGWRLYCLFLSLMHRLASCITLSHDEGTVNVLHCGRQQFRGWFLAFLAYFFCPIPVCVWLTLISASTLACRKLQRIPSLEHDRFTESKKRSCWSCLKGCLAGCLKDQSVRLYLLR